MGGRAGRLVVLNALVLAAAAAGIQRANAQTGAPSAGVTVVGHAAKTFDASEAYVVLTPEPDGISSGGVIGVIEEVGGGTGLGGDEEEAPPLPSDEERRAKVVTAVAPLGIDEADVKVHAGGGQLEAPFQVEVEVLLSKLPGIGDEVVRAAESAVGALPSRGVEFGVSRCESRQRALRKRAVADGRRQGRKLARLTGVDLGHLRGVQSLSEAYGGLFPDPCAAEGVAVTDLYDSSLAAFDAAPRVRLVDDLRMTFAIDGVDDGEGVSSTGRARSNAPADRATVVIVVGSSFDMPSESPEERARRNELIARLEREGLAPDGATIDGSAGFFDSTAVRVPVDPDAVRDAGPKIRAIIEDEFEFIESEGVVFSSSRCTQLLESAQKKAWVDARREVTKLAKETGVRVGDVVAASTFTASSALGLFGGTSVRGSADDVDEDCLAAVPSAFSGFFDESDLKPFAAEPVFEVPAEISLTRAIAG